MKRVVSIESLRWFVENEKDKNIQVGARALLKYAERLEKDEELDKIVEEIEDSLFEKFCVEGDTGVQNFLR